MKIERIATEMEQLAEHGTILPENMQGLNESQVSDLKLVDPFTSKCIPSGGLGSATCPFFQNWSGRLTGFFNFCQIFRQVDRQVKKSSKKWTGLYLYRLNRFLPAQVEQVFTCTGSRQVVYLVTYRMVIE